MSWYPFDSQLRTMKIYVKDDAISFIPDTIKYSGPEDLTLHFVRDVVFCSFPIKGKSGIVVEVVLGRPLIGSILTVFLPTGMLLFISQMAKSFADKYLDMVIEVNLTVLLVLTTL